MYKGDSPSKKVARVRYWSRVMTHIGIDKTQAGKHLILASRDGGDISVLLSLGVKPHNIVAVDVDPKAVEECRNTFDFVPRIHHGDVAEVVKKYRRELTSAYLDFCGPIDKKNVDAFVRVVTAGMRDGSLIGMTFMASREHDGFRELVNTKKTLHEERSISNDMMRNMTDDELLAAMKANYEAAREVGTMGLTLPPWDEEYMRSSIGEIRKFKTGPVATAHARLSAFSSFITKHLLDRYLVTVYSLYMSSYQSRTEDSKGVPMATYLGKVARPLPGTDKNKFYRKMHELISTLPEPEFERIDVDVDTGVRDEALHLCDKLSGITNPQHTNRVVGQMLGVSPGTIAAWKAHRTMRSTLRA